MLMQDPISLQVMKHYERLDIQMHHTFIHKLKGPRTVSSENVYGRLKQVPHSMTAQNVY